MRRLTETISEAFTRLGPATQDRVGDIVAELIALKLGAEDRLAVLATAVAAVAATHHARHKQVYLEAVLTWALEISATFAPSPVRFSAFAADGVVEDGAEIVIRGLVGLLDGVAQGAAWLQDRLVLELALFAQLLGRYDANAVHLALRAVSEALGGDDYLPGRAVRVPLEDMALPLTRDVCLATVAPRGVA
jgi:hypothetical protein